MLISEIYFKGWKGVGCHIPDCPGTPDCFGRGYCNGTGRQTPRCTGCKMGWMGEDCNQPCVHGKAKNGLCNCDACYSGSGCQFECSGHGECIQGKCHCDRLPGDAYVGDKCELPGCPGTDGKCSGNGFCNMKLRRCECYPGWAGDGCDEFDCPGNPSCMGHGHCSNEFPRTCNCFPKWAGEACGIPCIHGMNYGNSSGCICDSCYSGVGCDLLCSGNGQCHNGSCFCQLEKGFKGKTCAIPSCPGFPLDCSGHGTCNKANLKCTCDPGWTGIACHMPDCQGKPPCNNRGICQPPLYDGAQPICACKRGWAGVACELPCIHGNATKEGKCECDPCYDDKGCQFMCSNHSTTCFNDNCDCGFDGWRGPYCSSKGCPGHKVDCSGHGQCLTSSGTCICEPGWKGKYQYFIITWLSRL